MSPNFAISVGSLLIDSSQVYVVSQITEGRVYYHPVADPQDSRSQMTGSVPLTNIDLAGFRQLFTSKQIDIFYQTLASTKTESIIDPKSFKDLTTSNDPLKLVPLIRQLWQEKDQSNSLLVNSHRDTLEKILSHICQEFSLVSKKSTDQVYKKIASILNS